MQLLIRRASTRWVRCTLVQARARSLRSRKGASLCLAQADRVSANLIHTAIASVKSLAWYGIFLVVIGSLQDTKQLLMSFPLTLLCIYRSAARLSLQCAS